MPFVCGYYRYMYIICVYCVTRIETKITREYTSPFPAQVIEAVIRADTMKVLVKNNFTNTNSMKEMNDENKIHIL